MRYKTEEGKILDTEKAQQSWEETRDWDGVNKIGRSSGSQWSYQTLYKSKTGRYYLEFGSCIQGNMPSADFVSGKEAAAWLLFNELELPEDLKKFEDEIVE